MNDDLVELLLESELNMDDGAWATCREAAIEILRLRAENEKLRAALLAERERCAKVADADWYPNEGKIIANAIRELK